MNENSTQDFLNKSGSQQALRLNRTYNMITRNGITSDSIDTAIKWLSDITRISALEEAALIADKADPVEVALSGSAHIAITIRAAKKETE